MATEAHFKNTNPITDGLTAVTPFSKMEEALAREIARAKIVDERKVLEAKRIFNQSEELKLVKQMVSAAKMNKERSA
jgi:hypothetical protein